MRSDVRLSKYHGLGNDFCVLVATSGSAGAGLRLTERRGAALARAVCDRHRGVGADGLLLVLDPPDPVAEAAASGAVDRADLTMRLHNADGSIAEMSGNGIRCFVHGAIDAGVVAPGHLRVATGAGLRTVDAFAPDTTGLVRVRVSMGVGRLDAFEIPAGARAVIGEARAMAIDVGNPHIVVDRDPSGVDIATFGPAVERFFLERFGGVNVEVVGLGDGAGVLDMVVWERGVGVTQACGTGATATALAAHAWGLVRGAATVRQPGGAASVEIDGDEASLTGPSQFIAECIFAWHDDDSQGAAADHGSDA
jgi:diaminopimelate epimerase